MSSAHLSLYWYFSWHSSLEKTNVYFGENIVMIFWLCRSWGKIILWNDNVKISEEVNQYTLKCKMSSSFLGFHCAWAWRSVRLKREAYSIHVQVRLIKSCLLGKEDNRNARKQYFVKGHGPWVYSIRIFCFFFVGVTHYHSVQAFSPCMCIYIFIYTCIYLHTYKLILLKVIQRETYLLLVKIVQVYSRSGRIM